MEILYEDKSIWVVIKPVGMLSESSPRRDGLADLLAAENGGYAGVVHRLDRAVGGVMIYAKTPVAAARLSASVADRQVEKEYLAIVTGDIASEGLLEDLLFFDRTRSKSFAVDRPRRGVKDAKLSYRVLKTATDGDSNLLKLLSVHLFTGRTHQIRVQFSHRGYPLTGDRKYGSRMGGDIGLFSHRLHFPHPMTGEKMSFSHTPTGGRWVLFDL